MRPSSAVHSGMPTGQKYMGWWGNLGGPAQKGVVTYAVSPYRLKPLKGLFSGWISNGGRRIAEQAPYFVLPLAIAYGILEWAKKDNALRNSKFGHAQGLFP